MNKGCNVSSQSLPAACGHRSWMKLSDTAHARHISEYLTLDLLYLLNLMRRWSSRSVLKLFSGRWSRSARRWRRRVLSRRRKWTSIKVTMKTELDFAFLYRSSENSFISSSSIPLLTSESASARFLDPPGNGQCVPSGSYRIISSFWWVQHVYGVVGHRSFLSCPSRHVKNGHSSQTKICPDVKWLFLWFEIVCVVIGSSKRCRRYPAKRHFASIRCRDVKREVKHTRKKRLMQKS